VSGLSPIDELLYSLDGESAVASDVATARLEAMLARIRQTTFEERIRLVDQIDVLHRQADFDHARAVAREIEAVERVREWKERVAESKGELAEQAGERLADARATAAAITEEAAEYYATVKRLDEVRTLIEAIEGKPGDGKPDERGR
jgi:hypothetical protein